MFSKRGSPLPSSQHTHPHTVIHTRTHSQTHAHLQTHAHSYTHAHRCMHTVSQSLCRHLDSYSHIHTHILAHLHTLTYSPKCTQTYSHICTVTHGHTCAHAELMETNPLSLLSPNQPAEGASDTFRRGKTSFSSQREQLGWVCLENHTCRCSNVPGTHAFALPSLIHSPS